MLLALGIVCFAVLVAALIAKFVLHLEFQAAPESLEYEATKCYENWAAHRVCPQELPARCSRRRALTDAKDEK